MKLTAEEAAMFDEVFEALKKRLQDLDADIYALRDELKAVRAENVELAKDLTSFKIEMYKHMFEQNRTIFNQNHLLKYPTQPPFIVTCGTNGVSANVSS